MGKKHSRTGHLCEKRLRKEAEKSPATENHQQKRLQILRPNVCRDTASIGDATINYKQLVELEKLKARMQELQAQMPGGAGAASAAPKADAGKAEGGAADPPDDQAAKEEADARSVYVGNVDYECTPEELQLHFQACGTVNRVTILTDRFGSPKGFAYVEFLEADAVTAACLLEGTDLHSRPLKVSPKRTNVPGLKQRGRGRGGAFRGGGGRGYGRGGGYGGYSPYGAPYGGGRFRGRGRRGGYNAYAGY